jgi:acetyl esterase/lipase
VASALTEYRIVQFDTPPTLTLQGTSDRLVPSAQVEDLHAALNASGVVNELVWLPATDHIFDGHWNALSHSTAFG